MSEQFNFQIDKTSRVPYYYQIEEWIRGLISSGQLKPGDMLSNEIDLSARLGVSRMTVRQALNQLTSEDLLIRQRAKGTFVAPTQRRQLPFVKDRLSSMTEEIAKEGLVLYSRVLAQEVLPAVGEIQRKLGLPVMDPVLLIRRLRSVEGEPILIENTYHPYHRFPELLTLDLNDCSIYDILEQRYHSRPAEAEDTIYAGIASREDALLLEVEEGAAVMHFRRVSWDAAGKPMEFTRSIYRADRYQFVIRYQKSMGDPLPNEG